MQELIEMLKTARNQQAEAEQAFTNLMSFFGENVNVDTFDPTRDFWSAVMTFVAAFTTAQRDMLKRRQVRLLV